MSPLQNVVVVGGGFMGSGIAQATAVNGFNTTVVDVNEEALQRTRKYIAYGLNRSKTGPKTEAELKLHYTTDLQSAVKNADVVIEAIVENLKTKQDLFRRLEALSPSNTVFATNTSTLLVRNIGAKMRDPSRFGGLHFFFPAAIVELVEVVQGPKTSQKTIDKLWEFSLAIKKYPVKCKDTPGFIVNRILIPQQNAAFELVDNGIATPEEIDIACEKALGVPMGPFKMADNIGLDVAKLIRDGVMEHYPELGTKPSPTLDRLVKAGKYGKKTGAGFYEYKAKI